MNYKFNEFSERPQPSHLQNLKKAHLQYEIASCFSTPCLLYFFRWLNTLPPSSKSRIAEVLASPKKAPWRTPVGHSAFGWGSCCRWLDRSLGRTLARHSCPIPAPRRPSFGDAKKWAPRPCYHEGVTACRLKKSKKQTNKVTAIAVPNFVLYLIWSIPSVFVRRICGYSRYHNC